MYIWYIEKREPVSVVIPTSDILIYVYNAEPRLGFFHRRNWMEREPRFILYTVCEEYNELLSKGDTQVRQSTADKKTRPFAGVLFTFENRNYFVPLTSPKPKHLTMKTNKSIYKLDEGHRGIIDFCKMIPVPDSQLEKIDFSERKKTHPHNYSLLQNQLNLLNNDREIIREKAKKFYEDYFLNKISKEIKENCVNFPRANKIHDRWIERENIYNKDNSQNNKKDKSKDFSR